MVGEKMAFQGAYYAERSINFRLSTSIKIKIVSKSGIKSAKSN